MGYLGTLTNGSFKTTTHGQRLFFPWGAAGRGYVIPSDAEFQRVRYRVKVSSVVALPLAIGAVFLGGVLGGAAALLVFSVPYIVWARSECRHLEHLTLSESIEAHARQQSLADLWTLEIGCLLFVVAGSFICLVDSTNWLVALTAIVVFGFGAVVYARMLMSKWDSITRLDHDGAEDREPP